MLQCLYLTWVSYWEMLGLEQVWQLRRSPA